MRTATMDDAVQAVAALLSQQQTGSFSTERGIPPAATGVRDLLTEAARAGKLLPDVDPPWSAKLIITTFTGPCLRG
ncbi:hypothetical protein EF908_09565 [Streptomyces sp. WAC04770]|nr:hypothetical protein [Streptomyces sp. WAC04770]RST23693.1 hypothetical protein EF908_09565 [Streptomyces sp. WAC04770]